ncbi:hypothetical protein J9253_06505 [Thiothrix litoralis]|jgi:hypothetical protein|uniref:Uncharacterized protein n=1 Tax=Thiothrix litoralis TaxID=2891210 RepID=A0ABX7X385_9GAMM|nr:hypothetical protein [Thiothrix litoralis]QTR47580.1 hypothetical protein J9253_06505 [Thiothrix litoralis]
MISKAVYKKLAIVSLVFVSLMVGQPNAMADAALSKVLLMATLNSGPAMRPLTWKIYRLENDKSTLATSLGRHSANIQLAPGVYRADVTFNDGSVSRSRTFDLRTVSSSNVIVAMD